MFLFFETVKNIDKVVYKVLYSFENNYKPCFVSSAFKPKGPVVAMEAVSLAKPALNEDNILSTPLDKMLLANDAIHPQYPSQANIDWPEQPPLTYAQKFYNSHYEIAIKEGYGSDSKTAIYILHFFPALAENL